MTIFRLILICVVQALAIIVGGAGIAYLIVRLREQQQRTRDVIATTTTLKQAVLESEQARDQARQRETWQRALFCGTSNLVYLYRLTPEHTPGALLEVNDATCARLGYPRDKLLAMTSLDIEATEIRAATAAHSRADFASLSSDYMKKAQRQMATRDARRVIEQVLTQGSARYESVFKTHGGEKFPVTIEARLLDFSNEPMILCTAQDITDRKKDEKALQESEQRLQDFFASSPFGVAMYTAERELAKANRACLTMFGVPDQAQFTRFNLFDNPFLPQDVKTKLSNGETVRFEAVVNFDEALRRGLFATTRRGRGHFDILISNMGHDHDFRTRGYFAQLRDVSQYRKVEADLRKLQAAPADKGDKAGITGSLADMGFADMIQILCAGGRNVQIALTKDELKGSVFIEAGNVVHCTADALKGDPAFYALMRWQEGMFITTPCSEFPARTVESSVMSLLMEGARQVDESG